MAIVSVCDEALHPDWLFITRILVRTIKYYFNSMSSSNIRITDKIIGKGSFAHVYLAQNELSGEWLAVKSIDKRRLSPRLLQSIWNEIQMMKKIHNENIIQLHDIQDSPEKMDLIMEYCNLGDLSQFIKNHRGKNSLDGIPVSYVYSFLHQTSCALQVIRQMNLVHRDLKPQNILLNCKPLSSTLNADQSVVSSEIFLPITLKLGDFGFARLLHGDDMAETLCGSPLYMAPEILRYEKYDAKADLWSVGIILYEMITGKVPFRAKNHISLIKKIQMTKNVLFPDEMLERRVSMSNNSHSSPIRIPQAMTPIDSKSPVTPSTFGGNPTAPFFYGNEASGTAKNEIPKLLKDLTRQLLKKDSLERIGFEEFFLHPCVRADASKMTSAITTTADKLSLDKENSSSGSSSLALSSHRSFGQQLSTASSGAKASNLKMLLQKTPPASLPSPSPVSTLSLSQFFTTPNSQAQNQPDQSKLKRVESNHSLASSKSQFGAPFVMDDVDSPRRSVNISRRPSVNEHQGYHNRHATMSDYPWNPSVPGVTVLPFANPEVMAPTNDQSGESSQMVYSKSMPHHTSAERLSLSPYDQGVLGYVANSIGAMAKWGYSPMNNNNNSNGQANVPSSLSQQITSPGEWETQEEGEYVVVQKKRINKRRSRADSGSEWRHQLALTDSIRDA